MHLKGLLLYSTFFTSLLDSRCFDVLGSRVTACERCCGRQGGACQDPLFQLPCCRGQGALVTIYRIDGFGDLVFEDSVCLGLTCSVQGGRGNRGRSQRVPVRIYFRWALTGAAWPEAREPEAAAPAPWYATLAASSSSAALSSSTLRFKRSFRHAAPSDCAQLSDAQSSVGVAVASQRCASRPGDSVVPGASVCRGPAPSELLPQLRCLAMPRNHGDRLPRPAASAYHYNSSARIAGRPAPPPRAALVTWWLAGS